VRGRPLEPFVPLTARVVAARARQQDRAGKINAWLGNREVEARCQLGRRDGGRVSCLGLGDSDAS
jgi:predicted ATPase with chaperone activity